MNKHTIKPINWNAIEPRIRPHVAFLRNAGFDTFSSCGHDMTVSIHCEPANIPRLEQTLFDGGYRDFELTYTCHSGYRDWRNVVSLRLGGTLAGDSKPFEYVLLKVDPASQPLYFVIRASVYHDQKDTTEQATYFYNDHTCPTNWIDKVVAIIADGDQDPHGFAKFVACKAPPEEDFDEDNDDWLDIFPELGLPT